MLLVGFALWGRPKELARYFKSVVLREKRVDIDISDAFNRAPFDLDIQLNSAMDWLDVCFANSRGTVGSDRSLSCKWLMHPFEWSGDGHGTFLD
jgi:hypothetical protein